MQRNNIRSKQNREIQRTTFILDELSIIISFFLAIAVRFKAIINWIDLSYGIYVSMLITVLIFCVIIFYAYDSRLDNVVVQDPIDNLVSTVKSRLFLGLMAIVYFYVAQKDVLTSRVVMVFFFLFSAILGYIFRMLYRHFYISRKGIPEVYRAYEIRLPVTDLNPIIEEIREGEYDGAVIIKGHAGDDEARAVIKKLEEARIRTAVTMDVLDYNVRPGIVSDVGRYAVIPSSVRAERFNLFGINYNISRVEEGVHHVLEHLEELKGSYVCFSNVHTTVMAKENPDYAKVLNTAALVFADGEPIARQQRRKGFFDSDRVAGPDFMTNMLRDSVDAHVSHFFYGSTEETIAALKENLPKTYPGIEIKGMYSPPFRPLTPEEDEEAVRMINESGADIVWVGLGAPKQENWMYDHRGRINAVMMGVGAGFDFHAGSIKRAPAWIQRIGLEWLFRLTQDPVRLLKRYIVTNAKFIWYLATDRHTGNVSVYKTDRKQVFCIGCRGIPAEYGGFETFMDNLTRYRHDPNIRYHVAKLSDTNERYIYNDAKCFGVKVPNTGSSRAVFYDLKALKRSIEYCEERPDITEPVFFIMACRIGPFIHHYKRKIKRLGGKLYLNPDGHDWSRRKWSKPVRMYWKESERLMVKHADKLICDSREIEKYIHNEYRRYNPNTTFVAYGADLARSVYEDDNPAFLNWLNTYQTSPGQYYIVIGRFVQENNFDIIIREFMKAETNRKLIIMTTPNERLYRSYDRRLGITGCPDVIIADSVYDKELVKKIRENAFAYIHGHEVGGTNPSLLEALASTDVNLVLGVKYNEEVVDGAAIKWNKQEGSLAEAIKNAESLDAGARRVFAEKAKDRIRSYYNWDNIAEEYEKVFVGGN